MDESGWRFSFCPEPPGWNLDWQAVEAEFGWVREMSGCPQDPLWHAEGDVLIHTRMVCEALVGLPVWRALPRTERAIVFAAALLHDVAKPACTREEQGRITSRGHSRRGAHLARTIVWEQPGTVEPAEFFAIREQIVALVRQHGVPLAFLGRPDPQRDVIAASQTARLDLLALVAEADVLGRQCADRPRLLERVSLFREFAAENGCLDRPRAFASDHSRFVYFRRNGLPPDYEAYDDTRCEVVLMSGLPGAGKDTWVRAHAGERPVVALDDLRRELDVDPAENQGAIVNEARDRARTLLRSGTPFVWNATNITQMLRSQLIGLFHDYRARVRIVYVETSPEELRRRNRRRGAPLPEAALARLIARLDVPNRTEAHVVEMQIG